MDKQNAENALAEARSAAKAGDHERALERYEWFFDHCLSIDRSFYGVRLSYVLDEWAELGERHPPARIAMEERLQLTREEVFRAFSHERFHDLVAISRASGQPRVAVDAFRRLHEESPQKAAKVFGLAWEMLFEAGEFELCSSCIPDSMKRYAGLVRDYDESLKMARPEWEGYTTWVEFHFRSRRQRCCSRYSGARVGTLMPGKSQLGITRIWRTAACR